MSFGVVQSLAKVLTETGPDCGKGQKSLYGSGSIPGESSRVMVEAASELRTLPASSVRAEPTRCGSAITMSKEIPTKVNQSGRSTR
jgi:hypothetical protein